MFDHKIRVSTSLIGTTGYNNHAQSFFKELSNLVSLEIRNFTVGSKWKGMSNEPHNDEPYIDDKFKTLLTTQTLWNDKKELVDYPIYDKYPNPNTKSADVQLILNETDHYYFYQDYNGYKIAYNVWESTLQPNGFFNKLLEYDELWVPSKWQKECTIKQGYPEDKIFVIPEGVDTSTFYPDEKAFHKLTSKPNTFTFGLFGRWDYRKSTKEIIETFLKTFSKDENVELIVSIDNPFSGDDLKTTKARLEHYGLLDDRIKIVSLVPRDEYIALMKTMNVFLSCSRSEGWNLPLIEAMACGTPAIYSNCCAQLEFAEGRGLPVRILGEKPVSDSTYNHFNSTVGNYYEPMFGDLSIVMRDAYENYETHKAKALVDAKEIHSKYNWKNVAKLASDHLIKRSNHISEVINDRKQSINIKYHFVDGPFLEITSNAPGKYLVQCEDASTGKIEFEKEISENMWVRANKQYYVDWRIKVIDLNSKNVIFDQKINLENRRVYVSIESKSLGDTLAWLPPIEEFRKLHNCKIICCTHNNGWFTKTYPNIEFVEPGKEVTDLYALYRIGWFYDKDSTINLNKNVSDPKTQPMQKSAFDILGLPYTETLPILDLPTNIKKKKQIAIAIHATCQAKYWNKSDGWQKVVDWCKSNGYKVLLLSKEQNGFMGNVHPTGIDQLPAGDIKIVMKELMESEAFVGIGSGLSWLSWAVGTKTVIVSGFSYGYTETQLNTYRVNAPIGKCSGCFNRHKLSADDWAWCPDHKGSERQYECTRSISAETVIETLKEALASNQIN